METIAVVTLVAVTSVITMPMVANALANFRLSGDTRSVSNAIALAKMRAASNFSRVRLYVDLTGRTHHIEVWDKTASQWTAVGGLTSLSTNTQFSYGVVSIPPPSTQDTIAQAPACTNDAGAVIDATGCVIFNSRGVPIDITGAPTALGALYLTDSRAVNAVTVSATGMTRVWSANPVSTPTWMLQ